MSAVCDCLVLGEGITGASFAALVAKAGYRTVLVSTRTKTPFAGALSLMPASFGTLHRLEVVDALRRSDCPKKLGLRWFDSAGADAYSVYFCDFDPFESAQSWQVRQEEFGEMLLHQARSRGVTYIDDLKSMEPMWDGSRLVGMLCQRNDGTQYEHYARVTVDTVGMTAAAKSDTSDASSRVMISGMYRGAQREKAADEGATLLFQSQRGDCWFRYIPLADNLASVSAIGDLTPGTKQGSLPEDLFEDELVECPAVAERLVDAELVGELTVATHSMTPAAAHADNGRLIIEDALACSDPLIGAGPLLALKAGEWAADVVVEALRATDLSAARLGRWISSFEAAQQRFAVMATRLHAPGFDWKEFLERYAAHRAGIANLFAGKVLEDSAIQFCDALGGGPNGRSNPGEPSPIPHNA